MEKQPPRPMTPFDELVTPPQLHMMKLFLPYTPSSNQRFLGVFVKFLELKEAISFFQTAGNDLHTQAFSSSSPPSFLEIMQEIKPYMPPKESEMIDTLLNMMNIMEMAQMFQGNPDITPGSGSGENDGNQNMGGLSGLFSGGFNPMDMMMGMLTPEQQNMFQMYNNMFANDMEADHTDENNMSADHADENGMNSNNMHSNGVYTNDTNADHAHTGHINSYAGNMTAHDIHTEDMKSYKRNTENVESYDINTEKTESYGINTENMESYDINTGDVGPCDIDTEDMKSRDIDTESMESCDIDTKNMSRRDIHTVDMSHSDVHTDVAYSNGLNPNRTKRLFSETDKNFTRKGNHNYE